MLKGIISKSNQKLSWEEYLVSNDKTLFPISIRSAICKEFNKQRTRWMSPSSLMYCLRKAKWEFTEDYYITENSAYILIRGLFIHKIFEDNTKIDENTFIEKDVIYKLKNVDFTLSGRIDLWQNNILYDYKSISDTKINQIIKYGPKEEHIWQTNIYKHMLEETENIITKSIKIIYVSMSNIYITGEEALIFDKGQQQTVKIPGCPIYSKDKIEELLTNKTKLIIEGYEPPPTLNTVICSYCYFKDRCKPIKQEKELF